VPEDRLMEAEGLIRDGMQHIRKIADKIEDGEKLTDEDLETLRQTAVEAVADLVKHPGNHNEAR
jgi:uncharacterized protein YutE (UPF0331/DUF86 family)